MEASLGLELMSCDTASSARTSIDLNQRAGSIDVLLCDARPYGNNRAFDMWDGIRAIWREWSILIVGLAVIFGGGYLAGRLSTSTSATPATSSTVTSDQAASSDQGRDQAKPAAASKPATPSQGTAAKQAGQKLAQSNNTPPAQKPANQGNPAPSATAPASAAAPSPTASPSPSDHNHMAAGNTP